jgi:ribonuclease P protein component
MSETSFPTPQPPTSKAAWVPSPDGDQSRKSRPQITPPEGPAPPGSLKWKSPGRSAFQKLRRASTARSGPIIVSWVPPEAPGCRLRPVLAFAIGKRVGNAVVRNRLRRRLRQAALCHLQLPAGTYLIRTTPMAATLAFPALRAHLAGAVRALGPTLTPTSTVSGPPPEQLPQ